MGKSGGAAMILTWDYNGVVDATAALELYDSLTVVQPCILC